MKDVTSIVWVIPEVSAGSGGIRTIVNAVNELVSREYACTVLLHREPYENQPDNPKAALTQSYGLNDSVNVMLSNEYSDTPDCMIATWWATAYYVQRSSAKTRIFLIQDFEPSFYASSEYYLAANKTYSFGFEHIVIGKGLARKFHEDLGIAVSSFDFGVDFEVYHPLNIERERAICALYQPGKPHRCTALLESSLKLLHLKAPDTTIYLYGSNEPCPLSFVRHLGLLDLAQCNALYNKCIAGICLSASNPSRIPFEMMAAGLPVIDLYGQNTIYDYQDNTILLSDCTPQALTNCMLSLLENPKKAAAQTEKALLFIEGRNMQREVSDIADLFEAVIKGSPHRDSSFEKLYSLPAEGERDSEQSFWNYYGMFRDRDCLWADAIEISCRANDPFEKDESLHAAIWSKPDQSDLIWLSCTKESKTHARCIVDSSKFSNMTGEFNIHIYSKINDENRIIAQTRLLLESPDRIESTSCPRGYIHTDEAGCTTPQYQIKVTPSKSAKSDDELNILPTNKEQNNLSKTRKLFNLLRNH